MLLVAFPLVWACVVFANTEGAILGLPLEERCHHLQVVLDLAMKSEFSVLFTHLEQVHNICTDLISPVVFLVYFLFVFVPTITMCINSYIAHQYIIYA